MMAKMDTAMMKVASKERGATNMMILEVGAMKKRGYKRKSRSKVERNQTARVASSLSKPDDPRRRLYVHK